MFIIIISNISIIHSRFITMVNCSWRIWVGEYKIELRIHTCPLRQSIVNLIYTWNQQCMWDLPLRACNEWSDSKTASRTSLARFYSPSLQMTYKHFYLLRMCNNFNVNSKNKNHEHISIYSMHSWWYDIFSKMLKFIAIFSHNILLETRVNTIKSFYFLWIFSIYHMI